MYADSKNSLKNIIEWLEGTDDAGWEDQIELGEQCRSDMERMARPIYRRDKMGSGSAQPSERNPEAARLNRANPHVRAMLNTMRSRNRAAALEHGKAALAVM